MRVSSLLVAFLVLAPCVAQAGDREGENLLSGKAIEALIQTLGYSAVGTSMRTVPWKELVTGPQALGGTVNLIQTTYGRRDAHTQDTQVVLTWQRPGQDISPDFPLKSHTTVSYFTGIGHKVNVMQAILNRHEGDSWNSYYTGYSGDLSSLSPYQKTYAFTVSRGPDGIRCTLTYPAKGEMSSEMAQTWLDQRLFRP